MKYLTIGQLDSLREIDTPTVANAVETHESRLNTEGFMGWNIRCQFPDLEMKCLCLPSSSQRT